MTTCPYCKEGSIDVADNGFSLYCNNDDCGAIWECVDEGNIKDPKVK